MKRAMREASRKCQAVIDDASASEVERRRRGGSWRRLRPGPGNKLRGTEGSEQRQVRAVRQAIRSFEAEEDEIIP